VSTGTHLRVRGDVTTVGARGQTTSAGQGTMAARRAPSAWLYLAGMATLAVVVVVGPMSRFDRTVLQLCAAVLSVVAVLACSARARDRPMPAWAARHHDPSLVVAAALVVAMAPDVLWLGAVPSGANEVWPTLTWLLPALAAGLAAVGLLVLIHNMAPGRVLEALSLAAITATGACLVTWASWAALRDDGSLQTGPSVAAVVPAGVAVFVVALGAMALRMRGSTRGSWVLLVLGWTVVAGIQGAAVAAAMTEQSSARPGVTAAWIVAVALVGASALHPHATRPAEPVHALRDRLPAAQVLLLSAAVTAGPVLTVVRGTATPALGGLVLSTVLALLVVVHLVHLVQGRALLQHRAHHDELTGLANRRLFEDQLALAIAHARSTGGHSAVLFLDLDRFKNVNDSLGHAVGNLLLQAVANRLRGAARSVDTVARLGGDEFVVVVPELREAQDAQRVADHLLRRFSDPFSINGNRVFVSPSIGIAVYPSDGTDVAELIENADRAMYQAKQRGRRRSCTYEQSMGDHAQDRLDLESRLHTAVERGELRMHYQPKLHLPTGRFTGMEALLRWQHPELGLLEPARFVPLAEESGLIVPIGEWALEEACRQNKEWIDKGLPPLVVAVNMSLQQFQQQAIEDVTARILRATGLDPRLLELELTESLAMHDQRSVHSALADIRQMGVTCSIDDFGTGYSGLSHLTQMPIDKLKIDKSFVATIDAEREAPIVVAVVALAHGLGLEVVAEGVETSAQLERLLELGCDEMQGFLFGRPMDAVTFEDLLTRESMTASRRRLGDGGPIASLDAALSGSR
jgi:diguanylate cyclase (GGDEF)-like protein